LIDFERLKRPGRAFCTGLSRQGRVERKVFNEWVGDPENATEKDRLGSWQPEASG
jgi:hypothetical protein